MIIIIKKMLLSGTRYQEGETPSYSNRPLRNITYVNKIYVKIN